MSDGASETNERLLVNGRVYTVNDAQPWAEAVLVVDGTIAAIGSDEAVRSEASESAEIVDLEGAFVMPGIHDIHSHPLEARSPLAGTCLLDNQEEDAEAFIPILETCAPTQIGTDWVLGSGHSVFTLLEAERLPVEILDEAIPDRPVAIMEETSHSVWVNSLALEMAGITASSENPPGGVIVKDPTTGEPTGLLFDSAGDLVFDLAWQPTPEIQNLNVQGLLEAVAELNENGITSVGEGRTYWRRGFQDAWLRAEEQGDLTVRAVLNLWAYPSQPDATQIPALRGLYRNDPDALVRISNIKVYSDGILINSTAAMLEPYLETLGDIPSSTGLNYFDEARLTRYIRELADFDIHIHAIGDRGVREALNAIEAGQSPGDRHRMTHLEVVDPADIPRFAALDVIADMQVAGDFTQPENWSENAFLIGDRASPLVPLRFTLRRRSAHHPQQRLGREHLKPVRRDAERADTRAGGAAGAGRGDPRLHAGRCLRAPPGGPDRLARGRQVGRPDRAGPQPVRDACSPARGDARRADDAGRGGRVRAVGIELACRDGLPHAIGASVAGNRTDTALTR